MDHSVSTTVRDYIDSLAGPAVYKDRHSTFQYLNAPYGALVGLQHHLDFIGGMAADLPCGAAAAASSFEAQDRQVIETGKILKNLDIHPYADGQWGVHIGHKEPVFDADRQIVGSIWHGTDITNAYTMAIGTQLAQFGGEPQSSYVLSGDGGPVALSPRESEVLFLILRGKTAKLAAVVLGLSHRTVQQYIETLRQKFGVDSKIELIDAAMAQGYLSMIPLSIFSKQLSVVLAAE